MPMALSKNPREWPNVEEVEHFAATDDMKAMYAIEGLKHAIGKNDFDNPDVQTIFSNLFTLGKASILVYAAVRDVTYFGRDDSGKYQSEFEKLGIPEKVLCKIIRFNNRNFYNEKYPEEIILENPKNVFRQMVSGLYRV